MGANVTLSYSDEVLDVVCPVCCAAASGRCLNKTYSRSSYRNEPHRERVWKAKGYRWYCFDCDEMVAENHILSISDKDAQTGTCRLAAVTAMREAA
jgi:hypothetical protein